MPTPLPIAVSGGAGEATTASGGAGEAVTASGGADEARLVFTVTANGFLMHMVRILCGSVLEVGCGLKSVADLKVTLTHGELTVMVMVTAVHGDRDGDDDSGVWWWWW